MIDPEKVEDNGVYHYFLQGDETDPRLKELAREYNEKVASLNNAFEICALWRGVYENALSMGFSREELKQAIKKT